MSRRAGTDEWTAPQVAEAAGITYRQLDYWIREGYLPFEDPTPGIGNHRIFTSETRDMARWMGLLVRHGLEVGVAATVAAGIQREGRARLGLFVITAGELALTP